MNPFLPKTDNNNPVNNGQGNDLEEIRKRLGFVPDLLQSESSQNISGANDLEGTRRRLGFVPRENSEQYGDDFTEKSAMAGLRPFANEAIAGAVGALPDLAGLGINAGKWATSQFTGEKPEYVGSVTDKISDFLNQGLPEKDKLGNIPKYATRFLSGLFGLGYAGKGIEVAGKALEGTKKISQAGNVLEKTGAFISKNLGMTEPSLRNIGAATAAGATAGFSKDAALPAYVEIPAVLFAFLFGGGAGNKTEKLLKPLLDKIPGLGKYLEKQNYKDLANMVSPEDIGERLKISLMEKEGEFLTQKTLSELPPELQQKLKDAPQLLNDEEINIILKKGMADYQNFLKGLEKEYGINLTAGEFTASPKVLAKEDSLANKPDIETFDKFTRNRRSNIVRRLEHIKKNLSSEETDKAQIGQTIAKEVDKIYEEARSLRSKNWVKNFGEMADANVIPVPSYVAKLQEFEKLNPDTAGHKVAIKLAKEKLESISKTGGLISPKRANDILVGHNEDLIRFPNRSFSRKQVGELKNDLESDLDAAAQNASIAEVAQRVQKARAAYKEDSQLINQIDESILFNKIDKGSLSIPEKIAKSFEAMEPTQIKLTIDALKRSENYNQIMPEIQQFVVSQALKAATKNGIENFNPRVFLQNLPEEKTFNLLFEGSPALKEIKDISVLLRRIWKFGPERKGSPTAQRLQADRGDIEDSFYSAGLSLAKARVPTAVSTIAEAIGKKNSSAAEKLIAEILISPESRQEILKFVDNPKEIMKWKAAAAQELINKKEAGERKINFGDIPIYGKSLSKISESLSDKNLYQQ